MQRIKFTGEIAEIRRDGKEMTVCRSCFRPISPQKNYCPWHDHFEVPEKAVFFYKKLSFSNVGRKNIAIIVDCPLFIQETPEDRERIRKRNIDKAEKELTSKQGRYYKVVL